MKHKQRNMHLTQVALVVAMTMVICSVGRLHAQTPMAPQSDKGYLSIFYPLKSATLSAEVSGVVKAIAYDMGETFRKADVLIQLDADFFLAEKEKAEAAKSYAASVFKSKHALYLQKSVSTLEYAKAKADYQASKADFDIAQKKVAACNIRAPYNGKVVKHLVRENEFVTEGRALLEIIDDSIIQVKFHLPSSMYGDIQVGRKYYVQVKNLPLQFECKISHISPVVESNTSSVQVFGEINNDKGEIRAGMTGYIMIDAHRSDY